MLRFVKRYAGNRAKSGLQFVTMAALICVLSACDAPALSSPQTGSAETFARNYAFAVNEQKGEDFGTYTLVYSKSRGKTVETLLRVTDAPLARQMRSDRAGETRRAVQDLRRTLCARDRFPLAFENGLRIVDIFQDQSGAELMRVVVDRC